MSRSSLPPRAKQAWPKRGRPPDQSQQNQGLVNMPRRLIWRKGRPRLSKRGRPPNRATSPRRVASGHHPSGTKKPRHKDSRRDSSGSETDARPPLRKGQPRRARRGRPPDRATSSDSPVWKHRPPDTGRPQHTDDRHRQPNISNPSWLPRPPELKSFLGWVSFSMGIKIRNF